MTAFVKCLTISVVPFNLFEGRGNFASRIYCISDERGNFHEFLRAKDSCCNSCTCCRRRAKLQHTESGVTNLCCYELRTLGTYALSTKPTVVTSTEEYSKLVSRNFTEGVVFIKTPLFFFHLWERCVWVSFKPPFIVTYRASAYASTVADVTTGFLRRCQGRHVSSSVARARQGTVSCGSVHSACVFLVSRSYSLTAKEDDLNARPTSNH